MLRLHDIMTTEILTVDPETSVREAMEILGRHHVSGVPVVAGGKLVGVVTATDLMTLASALAGVPRVRDTADASDWEEAALVGVDDDNDDTEAVSFTDFWDDAGAEVVEREASTTGPEWNVLEEHYVSEAMTHTPLFTLPPDSDVRIAATMMANMRIHRVLVTDRDRLVGIVSALDVAKAVAEHKLVDRTYVFNADHAFGR